MSIQLQPTDATETLKFTNDEAALSSTIKNMLDDLGEEATNVPIPLHNVTMKILEKVAQYCRYRVALPREGDEIKCNAEWEKKFVEMDQATLFELILAANYLDIKPLLDLTCKTVAEMIKGKSPEEIRVTFNIKNDFTPEEEEKVRKENEWCEEK